MLNSKGKLLKEQMQRNKVISKKRAHNKPQEFVERTKGNSSWYRNKFTI